MEVVPVGPRAAYVRIHLDYYNGHTCGIYGIATSNADTLVYLDPQPSPEEGACVLTIRRSGKSLSVSDSGGSCRRYCGARGSLSEVKLPYQSKRPIRYLVRLMHSPQYRAALKTWQARKRAQH